MAPSAITDSQVKTLLGFGLNAQARRLSELLRELPARQREASLRRLVEDLRTPLRYFLRGPIRLTDLCELSREQLKALKDESFYSALTSPQTGEAALRAIAQFGELLQEGAFPHAARMAGGVMSALAHAALRQHHGEVLQKHETELIGDTIAALQGATTIPDDWQAFSQSVSASLKSG